METLGDRHCLLQFVYNIYGLALATTVRHIRMYLHDLHEVPLLVQCPQWSLWPKPCLHAGISLLQPTHLEHPLVS